MKVIVLAILLFSFTTGCSNTNLALLSNNDASSNKQIALTNHTPTNQQIHYIPNPQVPNDSSLLEIGQTVHDVKGEAMLKAITVLNETSTIGPIKLTIKDAKVIHLKPDYSMIDFFHSYTHEEQFSFVKVFVEIENTGSKAVHFSPAVLLETNTGEKIAWEQDIYLEELNGKIEGNTKKHGNVGFIVENDGIASIELTTSDVFNEKEEKISDAKTIIIPF